MAYSVARSVVGFAAYAAGLLPSIGGRIVSASGVLLLSIVATRQLDATQSGKFFTAFTALMGLGIFLRMGLDVIILREVSRAEKDEGIESLYGALNLVFVACAFCMVGILAWGSFYLYDPTSIFVAAALFPISGSNIVAAFLKAKNQYFFGSACEVGSISLITAAVVPLISPDNSDELLHILLITSWIFFVFMILVCLSRFGPPTKWASVQLSRLLKGRNIWAVSVFSYISQWASLIFVSILMPVENVTTVNMLFRLLAPLQFVVLAIDYWLAPKYSRATNGGISILRRRGIIIAYTLCVPYAFLALFFPSEMISFLFGAHSAQAAFLLQFLVAATLVQIGFGANGILLNMVYEDRLVFLSVLLRGALTFIILFLLYFSADLFIVSVSFALPLVVQAFFLRNASDRILTGKRIP